jgi:hypothetical protein
MHGTRGDAIERDPDEEDPCTPSRTRGNRQPPVSPTDRACRATGRTSRRRPA